MYRKTPLKPGYTLATWNANSQRLMQEHWTNSNFNPIIGAPVTAAQLAQHKTVNDLWVSVNGRVYDITVYVDYHPGGKETLLSRAGDDATVAIGKIHPWVKIEALLQFCYIGPLV
ncbi:cytochrome b5 reductase 4 [Pelomyxa schiedti]|nr:cytochrome b5 reductase 4 [Pelomyxa schiedti]